MDAAPTPRTTGIVSDEIVRAFALACVIVAAGFLRVVLFDATIVDALAISASLFIIVNISVVLGTLLPLFLSKLGFDDALRLQVLAELQLAPGEKYPAHSAEFMQEFVSYPTRAQVRRI